VTPATRLWHERVYERHVFLSILQVVFLILFAGSRDWKWAALAAVLLLAFLGMAYRHKRILDQNPEGETS